MGFLITGLPRSRTAWWAVTMDATHEPSATVKSLAAWSTYLERGISDSAIGLKLEEIMHEYAPRTLIVERPLQDVLTSAERLYGRAGSNLCYGLYRLQAALRFEHPLIRRIEFDDLNDPAKLFNAAEWLSRGYGPRALSMKDFNIQVTRDHALALAEHAEPGWFMEA